MQAIVSNEAYNAALANVDYRKIIATVSRGFRKHLPRDEIKYRGQMALFKCLRKHPDDGTIRFTTYLYNYVRWEMMRGVQERKREHARRASCIPLTFDVVSGVDYAVSLEVKECLGRLPNREKQVLEQKFIYQMTLREMEENNGYSHQTANRLLRDAKERFKKVYEGS